MSDTYYVKTFGGLEITNDNVTVNIVELFGKQLVNLLQVLLFHSEKPVQKDELIDILWPESKNPSSALKFSIFRLRAELNEIEFFKDKEVIVTTRKGYILNPNLDWNIDFVELEKAYNQINDGSELLDEKEFKTARKIFRLYQGRFYASPSQLHWILQKQEIFRQMYVKTMMRTSCYLYTQKRYDEMMLMNYQAVLAPDIATFAVQTKTELPATEETLLILAEDKVVSLKEKETTITYDSVAIKANEENISKKELAVYNQLVIPRGKRSVLTFSDGSKVWVNAGTRVIYPTEFEKDKREIYVDGEIYIEVER